MRVDIRPTEKLRGTDPVNVPDVLGPVLGALSGDTLDGVDLSRLRVVCDWIQYRDNFRAPIDLRPVLAHGYGAGDERGDGEEAGVELAVDLRRCRELAAPELERRATEVLAGHQRSPNAVRVPLEPWVAGSQSCIWRFDALYWQALDLWERASGREYEQALPGGRSDGRDPAAARETIAELFDIWDELDARGQLPSDLYVVELGVGNGSQARIWLDEFVELDRQRGSDYYGRLHYLMGDYSGHVLERARRAVGHHADRVSSLVVDATQPLLALGFLRSKVFCVRLSNVYDNLPSDEVARIGGRTYLIEVRAFLPEPDAEAIAARFAVPVDRLPALVDRLLRLGPELLSEATPSHVDGLDAAMELWRDVWAALRLQERYVPIDLIDDPAGYRITGTVPGAVLRPLLDGSDDIRMHVSNGALASFTDTLPLLHPYGRLHCYDLFRTAAHQYRTGFHGPGKYDGSVVNWVNGELLAHVGAAYGYDVEVAPFAHRSGSNIAMLRATPSAGRPSQGGPAREGRRAAG